MRRSGYALASTRVPIAVADHQGLPEDARGVLPSAAELEAVIEDELEHREERPNPLLTSANAKPISYLMSQLP